MSEKITVDSPRSEDSQPVASPSEPATTTLTHGPSRREVTLDFGRPQGSIEIRSPEGLVELRITLTENGPMLHVSAANIQLEAVDTLALRCRRFEVDAQQELRIRSGGPLQVAAQGSLQLNGEQLFLNCDDRFIEGARK